jgi:hypothetical protein
MTAQKWGVAKWWGDGLWIRYPTGPNEKLLFCFSYSPLSHNCDQRLLELCSRLRLCAFVSVQANKVSPRRSMTRKAAMATCGLRATSPTCPKTLTCKG